MTTRRRVLTAASALLGAGALSGCTQSGASGDDSGGDGVPAETDVVVGPDSALAFEPESLTVSAGETVTWWFASSSHNVSCRPEHADVAELPAGAEPFASYDGDDRYATDPMGSTYSHTFSTPGEYVYACVPHIPHGMVGEIVVTE